MIEFLFLERGLKMIHKISGVAPPPGKTQPKQIKVSIQSPPNMPVTSNKPTPANTTVTAGCNKPSQPVEKENREVRISVLSTEPTRPGSTK